MTSQNILNLVDTAMVGMLGNASLAAVGVGSFVTFMSVAFFQGFASSVQAIAARRLGEGRQDLSARPLNGALVVAVVLGLPVSYILYHLAPQIMGLLLSDKKVLEIGIPYYQLRALGVVAVGANFAFRGFWNGTDRSRLYMGTLWFMHACNLVLNYVLIFGKFGAPAMGAAGAALGTTISLYLGTFTYIVLAWTKARPDGFMNGLPSLKTYQNLLKLLLPSGTQQFLFAAGMTVLTYIVGLVGTDELAITNVLVNLLLVALLIEISFGIAAGALAGQALGAEKPEEAEAWVASVVQFAMLTTLPLCLLALAFPDLMLRLFIHDPATLEMARTPLRLVALVLPFDVFGMVYLNALQGVGDQKRVMMVVVGTQWLFFLPAAFLAGPHLGYGLVGIWAVHLVYRGVQAGLMTMLWRKGDWMNLRV